MEKRQGRGSVSLTYGVDFPFDDAKQIENALAQLPGNSQDVRFDGRGGVHVTINGAEPPLEAAVSASSDGKFKTTTEHPIAQTLCRAATEVDGTLTDISVRTAGYALDDGKLYLPPVP
jgi:hypothetical protein